MTATRPAEEAPPGRPTPWAVPVVGAAGSALAFILALAPTALWPLAPVAAALFVWTALATSRPRLALLALAGSWAVAWWWIHAWIAQVSLVGLPALVAYLTVSTLLLAWALRRATHSSRLKRLPLAVTVPIVWCGLETFRATVFMHGYPWYLLGHPLIEAPLLVQIADLGGVTLVTGLVAAVAGAAVDLQRRGRAATTPAVVVAALVVATTGYGAWRLGQRDVLWPGPTILAIQTDLPTDNKTRWTFERQVEDFRAFMSMTLDAFDRHLAAGAEIDLIAWPETMLPGMGLEPEIEELLLAGPFIPGDHFSGSVRLVSRSLGVPMLLGSGAYVGLRDEGDRWGWDRHHNSAYLLHPSGWLQRYDKLVLTPFGETMPYISAWPWLERRLLALGARGMRFDLDPGEKPVRLALPHGKGSVGLATPICFEDTVASLVRRLVWEDRQRRAGVIVNLSNDGWFGRVDAGRWQHAQAARFRCIENRTPMVRVVNTGVTASYDSAGRLVALVNADGARPGLGAGALLARTELDERRPLAAIVGDAPGWLTLGLTVVLLACTISGTRRTTKEPPRRHQ